MNGKTLCIIPLIPSGYLLSKLLLRHDILGGIFQWTRHFVLQHYTVGYDESSSSELAVPTVGLQLMAYLIVAALGYWATDRLIPIIQVYTLRKGICGKDLGKRGTPLEDRDMYVFPFLAEDSLVSDGTLSCFLFLKNRRSTDRKHWGLYREQYF